MLYVLVQLIFCGHCYFSVHSPVVVQLNGAGALCVFFQVVYITVEDLHKVKIN